MSPKALATALMSICTPTVPQPAGTMRSSPTRSRSHRAPAPARVLAADAVAAPLFAHCQLTHHRRHHAGRRRVDLFEGLVAVRLGDLNDGQIGHSEAAGH